MIHAYSTEIWEDNYLYIEKLWEWKVSLLHCYSIVLKIILQLPFKSLVLNITRVGRSNECHRPLFSLWIKVFTYMNWLADPSSFRETELVWSGKNPYQIHITSIVWVSPSHFIVFQDWELLGFASITILL